MRAVDTNVLIRLLVRDDAAQTERAEQFIADGAWVSHLVLAESVWVLESVYELDSARLRTAVAMLLEHRQLVLQEADTVRAALGTFAARTGVGFTDCLIVAVASSHNHKPLGTFDRKLARLDDVEAV